MFLIPLRISLSGLKLRKIIKPIIRASKTEFVKVSVWSGIATFFKMITSFISIKVVSNIIGPSGIALVGQFMNSIAIFNTLGTGAISQGVTKYIAEHYDEKDKQQMVIRSAVTITFFCTIIVSLSVILFAHALGKYIFKSDQYYSIIILLGVSIGLYSFNNLLISILNGFKAFVKFVTVNIISNFVSLVISILLVVTLGLYGALLNCVISQSVILGITILFVYKEIWFKNIFRKLGVDKKVLKNLGGFTLMILTASLLAPYGQIYVRKYIAQNISLDSAGLWEAMNRISVMYLMIITTSISTFYLPRLSEIKDQKLLSAEVVKTSKIVLPALILGCLAIFFCRDLIIHVVFSKDFFPVRYLFAPQMIGDFFKISSWLLAYLFWAKALVKEFIIAEILFNFSFVLFSCLGVKYFGLEGSAYGYALNYFLYFFAMLFVFWRFLKKGRIFN